MHGKPCPGKVLGRFRCVKEGEILVSCSQCAAWKMLLLWALLQVGVDYRNWCGREGGIASGRKAGW